MKYKDFKTMSEKEMKQVVGGKPKTLCQATCCLDIELTVCSTVPINSCLGDNPCGFMSYTKKCECWVQPS